MKILVDHVLGHEPMPGMVASIAGVLPGGDTTAGLLAWVVVAGLVVFCVNSLAEVVLTRAWIRVGQGMVYRLAANLFARVQRRSLLFHSRTPVGGSMGRVTGDSWGGYKLGGAFFFAPGQALLVAGGVGVALA